MGGFDTLQQTDMYSSKIASILNGYGIDSPQKLAEVGVCGFDHAKKILLGKRPISKKIALRLKEFSDGELSTDFLFGLGVTKKTNHKRKKGA